ncbi:hypothetical protein LTR84_002973 [Exophiala bonariae]|uniref:C2H2-type domain-containing protein n=1 Tax=Exophiala bonariae TaxID=1690606 RepID=A0AAV9MU14_9EURO|nr:hypothetical protein LTR84_002973 [Exophiala bonariae]
MSSTEPILYNTTLQIFVCRQHGYATTDLAQHLRREHQLPLGERNAIIRRFSSQVCAPTSSIPLPPPFQDPIEGLAAPVRAYLCQHDGCGYISIHLEGISNHARRVHQWRKAESRPQYWRHIYAQTLFVSRGQRKYFAVTSPVGADEGPTPTDPPVAAGLSTQQESEVRSIKEGWALLRASHQRELDILDADIAKQDRTGWFNRTRWPEHFASRNLKHLSEATRLPRKDEPVLIGMMDIMDALQAQCCMGLMTMDLETRRWLRSPKREEPDVRPMGRLQNRDSEDRYFNLYRRFLCYIMRIWCAEVELAGTATGDDGALPVNLNINIPSSSLPDVTDITGRPRSPPPDGGNSHSDDSGSDFDDTESSASSSSVGGRVEALAALVPSVPTTDVLRDARELFPWVDSQLAIAGRGEKGPSNI